MRRLEARLCAITGLPLGSGEAGIVYHYCLGPQSINIRTDTRNRTLPSIAPITPAADWSEREVADLYGVDFAGHPDLGRLVRPPSLPRGFFRDAAAGGGPAENSNR
jgi:Ni,Fe-hydrogenase III component G